MHGILVSCSDVFHSHEVHALYTLHLHTDNKYEIASKALLPLFNIVYTKMLKVRFQKSSTGYAVLFYSRYIVHH